MRRALIPLALILLLPLSALAVPSLLSPMQDGVWVVFDDTGMWGGNLSTSITHQNSAGYEAKKVLDLSDVPAEVWEQVRSVRLSVCFMVRDYSWHDLPKANGLDETFEIVVNGTVHAYRTDCGAPVFKEGAAAACDWYDFELPKDRFTPGANEIVIRKAPSDKNDDYVYLAIDHSRRRGNSFVSFSEGDWTQDKLTIPGGNGEYMVRLYLLTRELQTEAIWRPGAEQPLHDPSGLILYAGARDVRADAAGLALAPGQSARVEWDPKALDNLRPLQASVEADTPVQVSWLDEAGKPAAPETAAELSLPAGRQLHPSGLYIVAGEQGARLSRVALSAGMSLRPRAQDPDMCPPIAATAGAAVDREPSCTAEQDAFMLSNRGLTCRFSLGERLRLVSLRNEFAQSEMVLDPERVCLFLVEVEDRRYAGSRDFLLRDARAEGDGGFVAELELPAPALRATLTVRMQEEGLRLGLAVANAGDAPTDFKLAFPHFGGLTVSGDPAEDYYFFPWGGGIISDSPTHVRRGYGDHEAIYQVMDLFSPQRGAGLYVRADDAEGWHKGLALRKYLNGVGESSAEGPGADTAPEYKWTGSLEAVEGLGLSYEYQRRTRGPGEQFTPAEAVLAAHPGDWHVAMEAYARWAHGVWQFRPYPSRLRQVHNMIAFGWGQDVLFRDGKYRTDFIKPNTDCAELMSWWDWSPLGPWSTPFDRLSEVLSEATIKQWQPYFVKDPVTGQMMWNNQPGDYDGYNERFGGLPAFREAIETYKQQGALVTLYTDPIRCDDATKMGQAHGRQWGVVRSDGEHVKSYEVWNMCHDVAEYRQWVADTMRRVMVQTGADGIRLDEYGHRGWACFSEEHQHTFAEPGVSQWSKCIAETTKLVRQAMDEVAPGSVLTTEHPAYDYLMPFMEGCITYDLTVQATPLRPLECNLQRFYFPECKAYELDHRGADLESKKKIWNAVESFGRYYPPLMDALLRQNEDIYQGRDCEPLIPTLARRVYVNRFGGGGKTMLHLYNATGHTFDGPVLALAPEPGQHLFDMLALTEVRVEETQAGPALHCYLPRDAVACIALLPKLLEVSRAEGRLAVDVKLPERECRLAICDGEGRELLGAPATDGVNAVDAPAEAVCVKLLAGRDLVDVAEVPRG